MEHVWYERKADKFGVVQPGEEKPEDEGDNIFNFFCKGKDIVQVGHRGGGVPGNIQVLVGQGSGQPDLFEDIPAGRPYREVPTGGLNKMAFKGPI